MVSWEKLEHAYGNAANIPALLAQLADFPSESSSENEPWLTLWSSLCHQGDIYSASFAAVPEIVRHLASAPERATFSYFCLPAAIEIARFQNNVPVPEVLHAAYFAAIQQLGMLAGQLVTTSPDDVVAQAAIAAFTVSIGQHEYANLVLNVPKNELPEVMEWYWER